MGFFIGDIQCLVRLKIGSVYLGFSLFGVFKNEVVISWHFG
jgi:hypothetical protein